MAHVPGHAQPHLHLGLGYTALVRLVLENRVRVLICVLLVRKSRE